MRLTARQWQKPAAKRRLLTACRFTLRVSGAHPSKMHSLRFADDFRERYETRYETAWRDCDYEGLGIWFTSFSYSSNHSVSPRAPTDGRIVIPQETASGDKGDPEQCQINAPAHRDRGHHLLFISTQVFPSPLSKNRSERRQFEVATENETSSGEQEWQTSFRLYSQTSRDLVFTTLSDERRTKNAK